MFRQDRTNPGTRVSQWKGRHDTAKGWPGSRVSTWVNGGLFGAAPLTAFGGIITQYVDPYDSKAVCERARATPYRLALTR